MTIDIDAVRADTPGTRHGIHLLACGSSLTPTPVLDAVVDHLRLESEIGGYEAHAREFDALERVYDDVASHIGAQAREIALMENATAAWCAAFYALPLKAGSRILTSEAEYAANYIAYLQRARRDKCRIEVVPSDTTGQLDTQALESMIDSDVALISITWVPTNGGLINPAAQVGQIARRHGIPYLLDACQAVGQMPVDVTELGCDFLSATGRKFLRGPRGTGFLYVAPGQLETLEPAMLDMYSAEWVAPDRYMVRDDARRFENWENAYALRAGLGAAVRYAENIGIQHIEQRVQQLAELTRMQLADLPGACIRDLGDRKAGIVSLTLDGVEPAQAVAALAEKKIAIGTSGPSSTRLDAEKRNLPQMIRIAPHYYNTEQEIERCVQALRELAR